MRLSVFGPGHPLRGGIASTTTALVRALMDRGHETQFLTPRRQYPRWLYPGRDDFDPEACPAVEGARAVFAPMEPWTWPSAVREARRFRADAWLFPYWTWAWAPWWRYVLRGRPGATRPPAVAVVHNVADHEGGWVREHASKLVLSRCQGFFTHAEALRAVLSEAFPTVPSAAHLLPPILRERAALNRDAIRDRMGFGPQTRVALFLGLIRPYKGVDVLIDAFSRLREGSSWRLIIAGEPWGRLGRALERQVASLALEERVSLRLHWIPEDDLDRFIAAADLVVAPYRNGSQSAVVPMALSRGLPVLSTTVGGLPEIVEDGVSGRLVEPGSASALARALEDLEGEALDVLADGAVRSAGRLTWSDYVRTLEGLVASL